MHFKTLSFRWLLLNIRNYSASLVKLFILINLLILINACSVFTTARKQKASFIKKIYNGNINKVSEPLYKKGVSAKNSTDELSWMLESGYVLFEAGHYEKSLQAFQRCETVIKDYEKRALISTRDITQESAVLATNLNSLPYKGRFVDKSMLYIFTALNYFALQKTEDALVEIRKMREYQKKVLKTYLSTIKKEEKEIENLQNLNKQKAKTHSKSSISFEQLRKQKAVKEAMENSSVIAHTRYGAFANPLVSYFSALGYLIENNYTEALVDFRNLYKMEPENNLVKRTFVTLAHATGSEIPEELKEVEPYNFSLNDKIVFVLFFNGRGAALKTKKFQMVLPFVGYTGIAFPVYEFFNDQTNNLEISFSLNEKEKSEPLENIADIDAVVLNEYNADFPKMITRIVTSTLVKEAASYAAVLAARRAGNGFGIAAMALTGFYKYLFNTADTRSWETLPKEVAVAQFPYSDDRKVMFSFPKSKGKIKNKVIELKDSSRISIIYIRAFNQNKFFFKRFDVY
jgi:hypothetical protein